MPQQAPAARAQVQASTQSNASVQAAIESYKARRSELNSQLVELTVRRDLLTQQLRNASGSDAQQLNAQLVNTSQRNLQVVKSLGDIDDAINKLLANSPVLATTPDGQAVSDGVRGGVAGGVAGTGVATIPPPVSGLARFGDRVTIVSVVAIVAVVVMMWRSWRRPVAALSTSDVGRLEKLQQSLDAIALEVERLGESNRFMSKVLSEGRAIGAGPAQDVGAVKRENVTAAKLG